MSATYRVLTPQDLEYSNAAQRTFALDVLMGLSESPKCLKSVYLYDEIGSKIFEEITELSEYYPTRCEFEIFEHYKSNIAHYMTGSGFNLVELGPGDGRKTKILLDHFIQENLNFHYVPIDISEGAMKGLVKTMTELFPSLSIEGLVSEFFDGIKWLSKMRERQNFVFFLGSNIGNFNSSQTRFFLKSLWNSLNHGDFVLIGFDLKKDIELLLNAYNDSKGVTSRFNLNLLTRINSELGGDFDVNKFRHYGSYDVFSGAMESYLVSLETQTVYIDAIKQSFSFNAWEPIHTESSFKYLDSEIATLAKEAGFVVEAQFHDTQHYFTDSLWRVEKNAK